MQEKIGSATVFVKIEDYKGVLAIIEHLKEKLSEARATLERLQEVRKEEDAEFEQWNAALSNIEKRIENIDRELLEPDGG